MENLKIEGQLTKIMPIEKGTSKAGKEWQKQSFVIDTGAQYNPEVCFQLFGDEKVKILENIQINSKIQVLFNVSSKEYNGRYFHNLDAWAVNDLSKKQPPQETGDLPF